MDNVKNHNVLFAWFGILAVAVFSVAWMCAAAVDPSWVFGKNMISEFGISDTNAKYLFNYGCMVTGALTVVFGLGYIIRTKCNKNKIIGVIIATGGVFLALVGVFTMDTGSGSLHSLVAVLMAFFIACAVIASAAKDWRSGREMFTGITVALVTIIIITLITCEFPMFEACAAIAVLIWLTLESVKIILDA